MSEKRRGSLLPLTYIFGSFFGAAMIAAAFAYSNYRFSQYKFVDFAKLVFYEKSEIFTPKEPKYTLLIFSSNQSKLDEILPTKNETVVAIDIFQKRYESNSTLKYINSDVNTVLELMRNLSITKLPSSVEIVHQRGEIYKQNSSINVLE